MERVQTNMVLFDISGLGLADEEFILKLREKGVLALTHGTHTVRMVTHRGIEKKHVDQAIAAVETVAKENRSNVVD